MGSQAGFIFLFAGIGFITSTLAGFYVGNRLTHILFVSSLGMLSFSGLGAAVYRVLESRVPEFLDFLRDFRLSGENGDLGHGGDVEILDTPAYEQEFSDSSVSEASPKPKYANKKDGNYGDHLVVNNIEIKNEPKLMAEAIRTMLAKDEEA